MIVPDGIGRATAQAYIESYFTRYPGVKKFMDETREKARRDGYVETVFGRRLRLPEIQSGSPVRRHQRAHARHRRRLDQARYGFATELA